VLATIGAVLVVAIGAMLFERFAYTPMTRAYVVNDTPRTVTIDGCSDTAVTVAPGERVQVSPFVDGARNDCNVFDGNSDLVKQVGCLYFPIASGDTVEGSVAYVSQRVLLGSARTRRCRPS
jgi:hypothetical protein